VTARRLLPLLAALAACGEARIGLVADIDSPGGVATFTGFTARYPDEARTYVAVTSSRAGEVRIIDPEEDRPVLGPTRVFPLAIPTGERPLLLASAPVSDALGDLLVVASPSASLVPSAAAPGVEVLVTWREPDAQGQPVAANRVHRRVELAGPGVDAASEIDALAAVELTRGAAPTVRLLAALSTPTGGKLAVVDFQRVGPALEPVGAAVVRDLVAPGALPFHALDLAVVRNAAPAESPDAFPGAEVFVATPDPLGSDPATIDPATGQPAPIFGVAQLRMAAGAAPADWPLFVLDARSPTTRVAAAVVRERQVFAADGVTRTATPDAFAGQPAALRVYAALDAAGRHGCRDTGRIRCGIATLVPEGGAPAAGLAPDPVAAGHYRAPLPIFGLASDIAVVTGPDPVPPGLLCAGATEGQGGAARVHLAPGTGARCTSAAAAVPSSDGNTFVLDLGRFMAPSDRSVVNEPTRTGVASAVWSTAQPGGQAAELGLAGFAGEAPSNAAVDLVARIRVTPGFTPSDTFSVVWQGPFPGLAQQRGSLRVLGGRRLLAADIGQRIGGAVQWIPTARIGAPELGVLAGDSVAISCQDGSAVEVALAAAPLPPGAPAADFTGGALPLDDLPATCWPDVAEGDFRAVTFTVRSSGLLLTSAGLGVLGRPELGAPFAVSYDPAQDPPHVSEPRTQAEAVSRKARRQFYVADLQQPPELCPQPCPGYPGLTDFLAPGPVVAFTVGLIPRLAPGPVRGDRIDFQTTSTLSPMARRPSGGAFPQSIAAIDRWQPGGNRAGVQTRFYVGYLDDQVFVFGPAEFSGQAFSIR
jgi:hypothetical protein